MRDRDRADLAPRVDRLDRGVVDEWDHVPEHVPLRRLGEEQPLPDRELGLDSDPEIPGVVADVAAEAGPKLGERQPALPAGADVLALVVADRTPLRLAGMVRRAGAADPQGVRR
jgi:hypothetical protein